MATGEKLDERKKKKNKHQKNKKQMNILSGLFRKKFEKDDTKIPLYEDYNT